MGQSAPPTERSASGASERSPRRALRQRSAPPVERTARGAHRHPSSPPPERSATRALRHPSAPRSKTTLSMTPRPRCQGPRGKAIKNKGPSIKKSRAVYHCPLGHVPNSSKATLSMAQSHVIKKPEATRPCYQSPNGHLINDPKAVFSTSPGPRHQ